MRFHNSILPRIYREPGDEFQGGDGGEGQGNPEPFSVGKEDWERTQSELNELRGYKDKFSELEGRHNEFQERFKPFLENKKDDSSDPEPNPNDPKYAGDRQKYARELVRWEARQEYTNLNKQREASAKEQEEHATAEKEKQTLYTKLSEADTRGASKFTDYHAVINGSVLKIGQVPGLVKNLAKMKNPEDIAYHFGKNPQEAYSFMQKAHTDPDDALREMILLDHRFSEAGKVEKKPDNFRPTHKPGGKSGAGESMGDRVKSVVWDELNGR